MNRWLEVGRRSGAASSDWTAGGRIVLAVLIGGAVVGLGLSRSPQFFTGVTLVAVVLTISIFARTRLPRVFLRYLVVLLAGYAFLGRGFAYLGFPPLYVGEIGLGLGLLAILLTGSLRLIRRSTGTWLILALAAWSAICTLPYVGQYGQAAFRDAALWGYAAFALIVAATLLWTGWLERVPVVYGQLLPWLIVCMPIAAVISVMVASIPVLPGTDNVPILDYKPGDILVHLAGAATFLMTGLYGYRRSADSVEKGGGWLLWTVWLLAFALAGAQNRGGMLAVLAATGTVIVLRPRVRMGKVALIGAMVFAVVVLFNVRFKYSEVEEFSARQIMFNIKSVFDPDLGGGQYSGTRNWRLNWWGEIVDYTVEGPYFWTGKGYGINLANSDGFQTNFDSSLRSPHNVHMTVLARSGVPGFLIWVVLQTWFAASLVRAYRRSRADNQEAWAKFNLWILAFWVAVMVNASFDVYLEGPMGGIWFWSLFGIGMAGLELQRSARYPVRDVRPSRHVPKARVTG